MGWNFGQLRRPAAVYGIRSPAPTVTRLQAFKFQHRFGARYLLQIYSTLVIKLKCSYARAHAGDYVAAILAKQRAETLSSVLYPDDRTYEGKELRLKQQHFFVSATIQVGWCSWFGLAVLQGQGTVLKHKHFLRVRAHPWQQFDHGWARPCMVTAFQPATSACHSQSVICCVPRSGLPCPTSKTCPQDCVRRFVDTHGSNWEQLPEKVAFQLNDTHPSIAVAELMRVLMDDHRLGWTKSWDLVSKVGACVSS